MTKILTAKWFLAVAAAVAFGIPMILMVMLREPVEQAPAAAGTNAVGTATNGVSESAPGEKPTSEEHAASEESAKPPVATLTPATTFSGVVTEPGSLRFDAPDVRTMVEELRRERGALLAKAHELDELAKRLAAEKAEIGAITSEVLRAKALLMSELTNQMNLRDKTEEDRLKDLAKVYTNMPPHGAVQILNGMAEDDVAKILVFMDFKEQALILENFATNKLTAETGKATMISEKIRKLGEKPKLPGTK
ncbi:MAG: hypothetical protein HY735_12190 [Verrucomicrobia bacterium]|nr:hypothetical protein [Verrucomicrobiota bacterium]